MFMAPNLSEQFGWCGALAERAERPGLATGVITRGRFGLLAAFSGLVEWRYGLQDCLEPTKPERGVVVPY
jgi:hypothetical protein